MKKNSTDSRKARAMLTVSRVLVYALLIFLSVLCLFSFYMLIVNASRTNADLQGGFKALPQGHFLENLKNAWNDSSINIPRGMLNSFVIAAATAILSTYFSALTAYGLHAYQFKLKRIAFLFIMAVMVIPKQVSAAGFVQLCYKLKLTNSYLPLILPGIAAPVVFFYMIQYMKSVLPMEIVEAARVDGSGEFFTFNRIVLPMLKPAISVQLIFTFVESWNNYFLPALLLDKAEMKTVPIMIAQLRAADYSKFDLGKVYMFILLAILPVLLVYIFLSRYIVKGVTAGSEIPVYRMYVGTGANQTRLKDVRKTLLKFKSYQPTHHKNKLMAAIHPRTRFVLTKTELTVLNERLRTLQMKNGMGIPKGVDPMHPQRISRRAMRGR